jgi:hypothetical protein
MHTHTHTHTYIYIYKLKRHPITARYSCTLEKNRVITTRLQTTRQSLPHAKTTLQRLCDSDHTKNGGYDPPRLQLHFWFSLEGHVL